MDTEPGAWHRRWTPTIHGPRPAPPGPPFARVGKGSVARAVVRSRATKTLVAKPSLQYGQHQLLTGPTSAWQRSRPVHRPARARRRRGAEVVLADSFAYSKRACLPLTQVIPDR